MASPEAVAAIREQGGRVYVWPRDVRCCHGFSYLEAGAEPPGGHDFRRVNASGFELWLAPLGRLPEELHLDVRGRRRRRVAAYFDGCAWIS